MVKKRGWILFIFLDFIYILKPEPQIMIELKIIQDNSLGHKFKVLILLIGLLWN